MRQIAVRARVSVGTVSHVINNSAGVREEVRKRVLDAIERLGYQPSLLARGLRRNQTTILGVIIPDISNPFFPLVVRGVEDIAYQNSYRLMLCNTDNDAQKEQVYFDELRAYRMAGLIVIPSANSRLVPMAAATGGEIPVICLDRCPEGWKGDTVTVDNAEGAYQAAKYLLELGHRRIATITGQPHVTSGVERLKGFKRALREAGVNIAPEYIQEGRFDRLSGYEKGLMLLQFSPRPTAIFAANDLIALGVLGALREMGLRCPEDVSLVGFDDQEMASFTNPALTTVAQPAYQMGARAAALLFERLHGENVPAQQVVMKATLRVRDSATAPGGE